MLIPGVLALLMLWRLRQQRRLTIRWVSGLMAFALGNLTMWWCIDEGVPAVATVIAALASAAIAFAGFTAWLLIAKERGGTFPKDAAIRW